jgi:hypothetical protein
MDLPLATPELRPRCPETCVSLSASAQERRLQSPPLCDHSLCIELARVPLASAPFNRFCHTPYPLARLRVARLPSRWSVMMALRIGGSPPHPSSSHQPTSLQGIYFRASEPLLVLRASGVQIRYFNSWWKLTPLFQGALHHHRGLFSAHPLSAVLL